MATIAITTFINRSQQEVFDFMSNVSSFPQWRNGTKSAKWVSEDPIRVGSRFQVVSQFEENEMTTDVEVRQWDPPKVWGSRGSSGPMTINDMIKFESKDGGTLVTVNTQVELGGLSNMDEGLAIEQGQKQAEMDFQTLKKLLEAK